MADKKLVEVLNKKFIGLWFVFMAVCPKFCLPMKTMYHEDSVQGQNIL
jgi:hypothetical protein